MEILVVGAGSIGRRHVNNMNLLGYTDIDVVDINDGHLEYVKKNFRVRNTLKTLEDVSAKYDAAFILTPPVYHIEMALKLAQMGVDLFIEKPLSHTASHIDELIEIKETNNLVVMVGYNLRFNVGLSKLKSYIEHKAVGEMYYIRAEVGQYLPDWRPWQDYRTSYTALKELGGGILLDGSHEIDYVMWLVNNDIIEIKTIYDKVSDLEITVEDMAEIILKFKHGVIASIHLDMIERGYNRYCKVLGKKGSIKLTFKENILEIYNGESKKRTTEKYECDPNHSYLEELKHFFRCIKNRNEPLSNIYTAKKTLETVMSIKKGG
jgi:predicted dehydrogenase